MNNNIRTQYLKDIDSDARKIAHKLSKGKKTTAMLLREINSLYESSDSIKSFNDSKYQVGYADSVSGDFEFLVSRILYHYSKLNNLSWKIYLRSQRSIQKKKKGKIQVAPDIRVEKGKKIIFILEVSVRGGWNQPLFSGERYKDQGQIKKRRLRLNKYRKLFGKHVRIFMLLPSLANIATIKRGKSIAYYQNYVSKAFDLPSKNFILLSNNKTLKLKKHKPLEDLMPTTKFEEFIKKVKNY
jgi:hypothetical protein